MVTRGNITESKHYGAFVVVDSLGNIIASGGNPNFVTFMRSSSKPLQILSLLERGGVDRFGFTEQEIALMCSSHSGTDEQVSILKRLQDKVGISPEDLLCGISPPSDKKTYKRMLKEGEIPTTLRHNCSGKHTGMIALAKLLDVPYTNYISPEHPVQKLIIETFADMVNISSEKIVLGIDGCSAPVFAIPLYNAALSYARLCDPDKHAMACKLVTKSMSKNPGMVAGPGRFDTRVMKEFKGTLVSKTGAEGYQAIGILPDATRKGSPGIGICLKILDGDPEQRARSTALIEILLQLSLMPLEYVEQLADFYSRPVKNWQKMDVGEIRPCFNITHAR